MTEILARLAVDHGGRFIVSAADIEAWGKPWGLGQIESVRVSSQIEPGRFAVAVASATNAVFLPAASMARLMPSSRKRNNRGNNTVSLLEKNQW